MSTGWQSLDMGMRCLKVALRSADFQKMPAVVAVVQSLLNTGTELISHYTSGTTGGPAAKQPRETGSASPSADADAAPPMSEGTDAEPGG
jgi:hypothetical protein